MGTSLVISGNRVVLCLCLLSGPWAAGSGVRAEVQGGEPAQPADIHSKVEGENAILSIVGPNAIVREGDVICELDSSGLRDKLTDQRLVIERAELDLEDTKGVQELAVMELSEYEQGLSIEERQAAEGEIILAQGELAVAEEVREQTQKDSAKTAADRGQAKLEVDRAKLHLERAQQRKQVLMNLTHPKKLKTLQLAVESAKRERQFQEKQLLAARQLASRLEQSIAACKITAPIEGKLVYASIELEPGVVVRERQRLFRIVPSDKSNEKKP